MRARRPAPDPKIQRGAKRDPLEERIERALCPGSFIDHRSTDEFEAGLDPVMDEILQLVKGGDPERAVRLFETFIAGCYQKADELDDSDGSYGMFVERVFCAWITARQGAKADPMDTGRRLVDWIAKDDYGFCHHLDDEAVKALGKPGLAGFERAVREALDRQVPQPPQGTGATPEERRAVYRQRTLRGVLKTILAARGDAEGYVAEVGDDLSPKDCEVLADLHAKRKRFEEALGWVERGLKLKSGRHGAADSYRLPEMKRALLMKVGRVDDALDAAWKEFAAHPSDYTYDDLMKYVPKAARAEWRTKAMATAEKGDLDGYFSLCKKMKEWQPLAERIQRTPIKSLQALGHYHAEPVADALSKAYPAAAAKVYAAQALRVVVAKKSRYYDAAVRNLRSAKSCYEKAGLGAQWTKLVKSVREEHGRKSGFMHAFERVASGDADRPTPSFLDRARERWGRPPGR
jgi:tetratricopeptide (TPR) repeat protein